VLLRGSKRFRLWPPSAAPGMYVAGAIARIHPSGRIVYEGQGDIRADGASERGCVLALLAAGGWGCPARMCTHCGASPKHA
jgi:hypothetical protein